MPLLKRSPFTLLETSDDIEPHELVFQVRFTKEIFRDYQEYLKRIDFYRKRLWTCKVTGKTNLTYEEALVAEKQAAEKVQQFPEELIGPVLRIVQYSMLPLRDLLVAITSKLQDTLVEGLELHGKRDGCVCSCKIIKVLDDQEGKKYEVAWLDKDNKMNGSAVVTDGDFIRRKLPYTRNVLKSFIRESTYRNVPWVIHNTLASKYGIPTDPPEELKGKVSFLNGCIVSCRKRKKHDVSGEENDDMNIIQDKEQINYPIDDLLVQPSDDDPVWAERPSLSRDFRVPMDCVGNLMMVWDFCTSFGRLLKLSPFSLEDFESAICYKDSNITIIVETHSALLNLLIRDEGEYFTTIMKRNRKPKISKVTWTEYLCDFLDMINLPVLSTNIGTIKRGHYGLLDAQIKLGILHELVDQVVISNVLREKLEENIEKRQELAAEKRGEALEDGKKRREAKERLKACESSNGSENGHIASNGYHTLQNGNLLDDEASLQNHSFQNGESKHEDSELKEMTKQLMEEIEKNKEERKELLEREMEKRFVRTSSLGRDRDYNRYWFFRRDGRLFVESSDNEEWGYFCSREEVDALMASLNPKGVRERALKGQLEKFYKRICLEMQKRSKDEAHKGELDGTVVRRSTRVRAPPKGNPALAFLKYTNKWKEV